jgi:hypothetical protein
MINKHSGNRRFGKVPIIVEEKWNVQFRLADSKIYEAKWH